MRFNYAMPGRMTLTLMFGTALIGGAPLETARAQTHGVLREVYSGIAGTSVPNLLNSPDFPHNPSDVRIITEAFEAPTNVEDNYGQRMSALLVPPATGDYVFWISSDDNSMLYLSADEDPSKRQLIARVPGWTNARQWTKYPEQKSEPIALVAGQRYYIEALMKEGGGGDNLAVAWQQPNGATEAPIPGSRLLVHGLSAPEILQQPADLAVREGEEAQFLVRLSRTFGASYQWQRDGVDIAGATAAVYTLAGARLNDHNARFRCRVANSEGAVLSAEARLSVSPDAQPPSLVAVSSLGGNQSLTVTFSEPVEEASALKAAHYSLDRGVSVVAVQFGASFRSVVLSTTALEYGVSYTLTVRNVRDRAASANPVPANSQLTFRLEFHPLPMERMAAPAESPGPSSRRTALAITEIMYHPRPAPNDKNLEFIELFNSDVTPEEIGGFRLEGSVNFQFPHGTRIGPQSYLVVALEPKELETTRGLQSVMGPYQGTLPNDRGEIRLLNRIGAVLLEVNYSDQSPWPVAADNTGHSLVLARPSYGEGDARAWSASALMGGSPGAEERPVPNPHATVLLNEFLAHTDDPQVDFVELYNYSDQSVRLDGLILTDDPSTNRFVLPANTLLSAHGHLAFDQTALGFALNSAGESIYLINPEKTRVLDAIRFEGQANGVATGRFPDGAPAWHPLSQPTLGAANAPLRIEDVVINEIMYHPISESAEDEFIELHNQGDKPVNLSRWRLREAVSFTLPAGTLLPAKGYLVVAKNASRLRSKYPQLNEANAVGDYRGLLADGGEKIVLTRPDWVVSTNNSVVVTNQIDIVVDEVFYRDGGRWGQWADGGGSSLELIDPQSDNGLASNWSDSDERAKGDWMTVESSGLLDLGSGLINELQLFLFGAGECWIDDVEVLNANGVNLISNSTFESGLAGWIPQGNHDESGLAEGGHQSSRSLHVRARGRGDHGANRIRIRLTSNLSANSRATLRAKVRWLRGAPEMLLRLHGNHLEAIGAMRLPANLGTPGLRNSQSPADGNAGPAIFNVSHHPVLPLPNQAVTVTAQVHDPHGLSSLILKSREDPSTNLTAVRMTYRGAGFYSATIPGMASRSLAAFHIEAADQAPRTAASRFPAEAPVRECLIRFGEPQPAGLLGSYHLWITQATHDRWSRRLKLDNGMLDATFVYGNERAVYNIGTHYSGSPWLRPSYSTPTGGLCGYVFEFPKDEKMLGATDFVLDWPIRDSSAQLEQIAYWMARELDLPSNHRRFVHLYVNGGRRGSIYEDTQQPNSDMIEQYFPQDRDGDLYKIEDWFEFDGNANREFNVDATLQKFTTTGGEKKLARYRWTWRKRATAAPNDYTTLFELVEAVNTPGSSAYTRAVESIVDVEEWMRVFALRHIVGDWDSYGYNRGKNMYAYKPRNGKWTLMNWDIDFVLGAGSDPPTSSMFSVNDSTISRMYSHPAFRRAYYRAWQDAVNGPLDPAHYGPVMDAKFAALRANGVNISSPAGGKNYINARRNFLTRLLDAARSDFTAASASGTEITSQHNVATLTGSAPVEVKTIQVNGNEYPVDWLSLHGWSMEIPLQRGVNLLRIQGLDLRGHPLPQARAELALNYAGLPESPRELLVINEIMYDPAAGGAEFVEIYNRSTRSTFDISRFLLSGANFEFPPGTLAAPGQYLVVAKDPAAFASAYGSAIALAGVFPGRLDRGGETIKLIQPGPVAAQDQVIDEVTYDDDSPWPLAARGLGPSLQLIDPAEDNNRVGNWAALAAAPNQPVAPENLVALSSEWRFHQAGADPGAAWKDYAYDDSGWPAGRGLLYVESSALPGPKSTPLLLGQTTYYFRTRFRHTGNPAGVELRLSTVIDDGAVFYLNGAEIMRLGMPEGPIGHATFASRTVGDAALEGPFTIPSTHLRAGENVLAVEVHQVNAGSSDIVLGAVLETRGASELKTSTPGAPNSVQRDLPAFPPVWLNEIQTQNRAGPRDRFGEADAWVELYNSGTTSVSLENFYLSDQVTNLTRWAFPRGTMLRPGEFRLVWMDGQPDQSSASELHAGFGMNSANGLLLLSRSDAGPPLLVDYLRFSTLAEGLSYGAFPNGTPAKRRILFVPTPGLENSSAFPRPKLFINEWMAANTRTLADPADGNWEDWIELFNQEAWDLDLSGYSLTDDPANPRKFVFPAGTLLAAGKHLLIWADEETNQNHPERPDLHVNFRLSRAGESIALYGPMGDLIDQVQFGGQSDDISQGRYPDGQAGPFVSMVKPTPGQANLFESGPAPAGPIRFQAAELNSAGAVELRWTAAANQQYQVQFKQNLSAGGWTDLGQPVTARGDLGTYTDATARGNSRFYRIVLLP